MTGAAGNIAYAILFMIGRGELLGRDQPIELRLLDMSVHTMQHNDSRESTCSFDVQVRRALSSLASHCSRLTPLRPAAHCPWLLLTHRSALFTAPGCCPLSPAMSNAIKGVIMEVKSTDEHSIGDELSLHAAVCAAFLTEMIAVLLCRVVCACSCKTAPTRFCLRLSARPTTRPPSMRWRSLCSSEQSPADPECSERICSRPTAPSSLVSFPRASLWLADSFFCDFLFVAELLRMRRSNPISECGLYNSIRSLRHIKVRARL